MTRLTRRKKDSPDVWNFPVQPSKGEINPIPSKEKNLLPLLLLLAACHSRPIFPPGGYPYPEHLAGKDTELYYYPLKDKESRKDSIWDAKTYESWRSIGEPNLSLRPMPSDVFRFVYVAALNPTIYIIRMTATEMVVRVGKPTEELQRLPDTNLLNPLERRLISILDRNYPLDEKNTHRSAWKRRYLDSIGHLYPQLYDPSFYLSLSKKEYPHIKPWYVFTSKTVKLTPSDFDHLISVINASGYWHLPCGLPCKSPPMDGWGYSLEANTAYQYNFVGAASCDDSTQRAFDSACQEIVRSAGLQEKIHLVSDWKMQADSTRFPVIVPDVQLEEIKKPKQPKHHRVKTLPPNSNK